MLALALNDGRDFMKDLLKHKWTNKILFKDIYNHIPNFVDQLIK
jgi:hypothetical protein